MAPRTLPGIGLVKAFWGYGEDNWNGGAGMDGNLLALSVLSQLTVKSRTTALPGSPTNGDIYLVPTGGANASKIAVRDNDAWTYYTPLVGWRAWVVDAGQMVRWNGTAWVTDDGLMPDTENSRFVAGNNRISSVANPIDPQDATTKGWVENFSGAFIPRVASIAALRALTAAAGKAVWLADGARNAMYVYDPTITTAQQATDPENFSLIAHVIGQNGAWVNQVADPRRGQWSDTGGSVAGMFGRFRSGLRIGDSVLHEGKLSGNTGGSWLSAVGGSAAIEGATMRYGEDTACVVATRSAGGIGLSGAARATGSQNGKPIGVMGVSYNNSTNSAAAGWGCYYEGVLGINGAGVMRAAEFCAIREKVETTTEVRPYGAFPSKMVYVVGLKGGDSATGEINHLLHISGGSGGKTLVGFLFRDGALKREGGGGYAKMISIPENYGISQFGSTDGKEAARFYLGVTEQAKGQNLVVNDAGMHHTLRGGGTLFRSLYVAGANTFVQVEASETDTPIIRAAGAGANKNLGLFASGTGRIMLNYGAGSFSGFALSSVNRIVEIIVGNGDVIQLFGRLKP